jgi:hypothetical protein
MRKSPVSTLMLERYMLGETSPEEKETVELALGKDEKFAEEFAGLRSSDAEIRGMGSRLIPGIVLRMSRERRKLRSMVLGLCAAALALIIIVAPTLRDRAASPLDRGFADAPIDRIKGGTELRVYLKTAPSVGSFIGGAIPDEGTIPDEGAVLYDGGALHEGSTVQLAYFVNAGRYGLIFSIDGRSVLTLHYPYTEGESAILVPGKRVILDEAYTLDDAPDYEVFFLITSEKPLDVKAILDAARLLAWNPSAIPDAKTFKAYEVETVTVKKSDNE